MNSLAKCSIFTLCLTFFLTSCSSIKPDNSRTIAQVEQAGGEKVYRAQVVTEATATTDYQRTTGLLGKLFGGVSKADVQAMDRAARLRIISKLQSEGYDLSKVVFLPSVLDVKSVEEVGSANARRTGVFGGVSEHTYKKFQVRLNIKLDYLYLGDDPPENLELVDLEKMDIALTDKSRRIAAKIRATKENLLGLSVLEYKEDKYGIREVQTSDLNLSSAQRLEIRNQVNKSLAETGEKLEEQKFSLFVSLPTQAGSERTTFLVDSSDKIGSRLLQEVYLKGMISKTKGGCASIMASIFKK